MAALSSSSRRPPKRLYQPPATRESSSIPRRDLDTPPTHNSQFSCNNYSSSSNTRHPKAHEFSASSELKRHGRGQMKWWSPKNDDQQKTFETYKADIKAALTISRGTNVLKAYDELVDAFDGEIKYKDLGFNTFGEFLFHCDDILEVRTDGRRVFGYSIFLRGQADDDMQHVQDLVEETPNKSRIRGFKATHRNTKHVSRRFRTVTIWRQMKLPKTENLKGKLLGVDSYGFIFFQVNIPAINDGFDALKSSLQSFYNLPEHLDRYRINPAELKNGLMVVAYMQETSTFIRANIFETDLENNLCVVIDLEERDFHNVDPKDLYQIHQKFRARCPRAVMCTLAGLEPYMMTEEISDAFEVTPLLNSTEIKVTLLGDSEEVKVPCVKMTIRDSDGMEVDVVDLIKSHGSQFLKEITTQQDHQS